MALAKLTRRQLAYLVGSHSLAGNIDTRWTAGGSDTLTNSAIIKRRLRNSIGALAAAEIVTDLAADSDLSGPSTMKLGYGMGPGGRGQAKLFDDGLG